MACSSYEAAPPTLDYYLSKLPRKNFSTIVAKPVATTLLYPGLDSALDDLAKSFGNGPSPKLVQEVDVDLVRARANLAENSDLNALENIRDAAAVEGVPGTEMRDYVLWRKDHNSWFSAREVSPEDLAAVSQKMEAASPALKPCWLYLLGALNFHMSKIKEAEACFDGVLAGPQPNAASEMALYMKGRCQFAFHFDSYADASKKTFHQYLKLYPKGRFSADCWGWLGGLEKDYGLALVDFVKQAEATDHPEVFDSAVKQIEENIMDISRDPGTQSFDQIAQHPELALALTYAILNTTTIPLQGDDHHSVPTPTEETRLKDWRTAALPKLATAVLSHQRLYKGAVGEERYLTILAHAASDHGDQKQALALIALAQKKSASNDDFLFVKGLVLQRSGQFEAAIKVWKLLIASYPESSLLPGTRYRLALTLHDCKRDGDALLELATFFDNKLPVSDLKSDGNHGASSRYQRGYDERFHEGAGADSAQVQQTMETLLNFAPLESLASALKGRDAAHEVFRKQLRRVIVSRCLAHDDFVSAGKFTNDPELKREFEAKAARSTTLLTAKLTSPRNAAPVVIPRAALASGAQDMAAYWESHRFKLIWVPLQEQALGGLRTMQNGLALDYPEKEIHRELDSRDELNHAIFWWGKIGDFDPNGKLAPQALWKTIRAQRLVAEASPYALERASQTDVGKQSRAEYDRLRHAFPDSVEAEKYAVWWTIPALEGKGVRPWEQQERSEDEEPRPYRFGHHKWFEALKIPFEDSPEAMAKEWEIVDKEVEDLPKDSVQDTPAQFAKRVHDLREKVHPLAVIDNRSPEVNCLEDLVDLSMVKGLDAETRTSYVQFRLAVMRKDYDWEGYDVSSDTDKIPETFRKDPRTQIIADFMEALDIRRDASLLPEDFLKKYPKSVKREMVAFHQIRRAYHENQSHPEDPATLVVLNKAFQAYGKEFPHGTFANGVLLLHGRAEQDQGHESAAVHYYALVLEQQKSPELKQHAASRIGHIFDQLNDDELRHALLQQILKDQPSSRMLKKYVDCGELPFLKGYLLMQLASR